MLTQFNMDITWRHDKGLIRTGIGDLVPNFQDHSEAKWVKFERVRWDTFSVKTILVLFRRSNSIDGTEPRVECHSKDI